MCALKVSPLADKLRTLADSAKERLWVATPYIGSWRAVKRILGLAWQKVDVRLLTDKESGILARDTIEQFADHGPVRSLKGLHAKLYIVDDSVLLTSANLTETAFTRRYEAGLVLKGEQARELVEFYECLWDRAGEVDVNSIHFPPLPKRDGDEPGTLPKLYNLPTAASPNGPRARPRLNFGKMRIPPNSRLRWVKRKGDREREATVLSDRRVRVNGEEMSLTEATKRVLLYPDHPCAHWTYKRKLLSDIYDETYGLSD